MDTAAQVWGSGTKGFQFQPGFEYLQVGMDGRQSALALGRRFAIPTPTGLETHEYWYSGQQEMLHLVNGRIHTALGMTVEWRRQQNNAPAWSALLSGAYTSGTASDGRTPKSVTWQRHLDIMPGYRYGVIDQVATQARTPTADVVKNSADADIWFVDDVLRSREGSGKWVLQQWFALKEGRVVYSQQCLSPAVCFQLTPLGMVH